MVFKRKAKTKAVEPPVEDIEIDEEEEESEEEEEDDEEEETPTPIIKGKEKKTFYPRAVSITEMFNVISDKLDFLISKK